MTHVVEQETGVYGPLPPKIDSDKYIDECFMPAMPEVAVNQVKVNLTWLVCVLKVWNETRMYNSYVTI